MPPVPVQHTLAEMLARAEAQITRYAADEAAAAVANGALLIDVRQASSRERDGIVPGSLHIPLTVLEWRVAPDAPLRSPHVGGLDAQLILICDHGCSTILAAASLVELGFAGAGDVVGGFAAWRDRGLPTLPAPVRRLDSHEPDGMGGSDL